MTPHDLIAAFEALAEAPAGIGRLRELILQLAVRGKLVSQDPADEPAARLLDQLRDGRERLIKAKTINEPRHPVGVPVENEPHSLPSTWTWVRLGDAGAIVGGGTPSSSESSYWANGHEVPWLTPADMRHQPSRYITRGKRDITKIGLASSGAQLLPAGTVLFSSRAPIGHVGIAAGALSTNQGFKSCVPYIHKMSEYLYLFLREVGPEVDASASGTTFREVTGKDVALIPLPLPPLAEQHRIVARVDELMELLDRLDAARSTREATRTAARDSALAALSGADAPEEVEVAWNRFAERMDDFVIDSNDIAPLRQTVLALAVRGRLVPQDPAAEPATELLRRARATQAALASSKAIPTPLPAAEIEAKHGPFVVPKGWVWAPLGHLVAVLDFMRRPIKEEDRAARISNKPQSALYPYYGATQQVGWIDEYIFDEELVLLGEDGAPFFKPGKDVAHVASGRYWVNNHAHALRGLGTLNPYLGFVLNQTDYDGFVSGTTRPKLTQGKMVQLPVPVPPLEEQHRIVARVHDLMRLLDRLEERLASARTTHTAFAAAAVHHLDV